jgi:hypothetical protein
MSTWQLTTVDRAGSTTPSVRVPSRLLQRRCACGGALRPKGECEECAKKRLSFQREPRNSAYGTKINSPVPGIVHEVVDSTGQPLDAATRAFMEPRFGHDFSRVRVHADAQAAESARAVEAQAYTVGAEIVFGAGRYTPQTNDGRRLLAHELTHVVQQEGASRDKEAEAINRAAANEAVLPGGLESTQVDPTAQLLDLITNVEQVYARANRQLAARTSEVGASASVAALEESQKYVNGLAVLLSQLHEVASGGDESLKQRALQEFAAQKLALAEEEMRSRTQTGPAPVNIMELPDEGIATAPLEVSNPQGPAELEANRVADLVVSGAPVLVKQTDCTPAVYRQAEWAIGAGEALLAFEAAGPGEVEAAVPGPGWIALGATLLAAGVLIGAGTLMMSRRKEQTRAQEKAEPKTANPPPPPPDLCKTAIKILTQYERLAQKFGLNLPASRIEELNRLRDAGTITINHIPASLRDPFPIGTFGDMTLAAIRQLCGM